MTYQKVCFGETTAMGGNLAALAAMMLAAILLAGPSMAAQEVTIPPRADNENVKHEPFRMIGNIYWVGHSQVGSFLIKTSQGLILMDSTSSDESDWTRENIEKLGFTMKDIKIMLNSHPHAEHMGGFAKFKEVTGAKLIASKLTADEMAVGGRTDFREDGSEQYTPVKSDQVIADGEKVTLGDVALTAHLTPGHTKGCTTWTTTVQEDGKTYNVVFFCGMATAGIDRAPLLNNPKYPNIVEDYQHSFQLLRALPCDVFLYARATTIHLQEKEERLEKGVKPNPFVDPAGCKGYIDEYQGLFEDQLQQQLAAAAAQKKTGQ